MLNLEELEQFVAFAECGTLSKVAEEFHISTPSITRSMQNVEESFGVPLFTRSKNRIALNETGEVAVTCARRLLQEADQALSQVRAYDERRKTIVVKSCAPAPLWELMKKLGGSHPGMTVSSEICQNAEVQNYLEQGKCDMAILPFPVSLPGWKSEKFMTEKLFICVPREHELAEHTGLYWNDLNGFNFLLKSELGFWDSLCRENMPVSKFLVQTEEEVFDELVKASSLPCFTTDYFKEQSDVYAGRVNIPIMDEDANVTFYLITKK
jgi:DNA-binding transcriptional LysR family regulator